MMWAAAVAVLLASGVYFLGRLLYVLLGGAYAVSRATARARQELNSELAGLSTEDLRRRLLQDQYLSDLRSDAGVKRFLSRIAGGDEIALAREYPRATLYRLLAGAERAAGVTGRPEAVDAITEIAALLQELARRSITSPNDAAHA